MEMNLDFRGVIDRRILVNYRVDPSVLKDEIPDLFEPLTVDGWGIGGICLIRLRDMRPSPFPSFVGVGSENAAHRIAVSWMNGRETGVYVPRRDTSSWINAMFGDRLFGGAYGLSSFRVDEDGDRYSVQINEGEGEVLMSVEGQVADEIPDDSVFDDLEEASKFFRRGSTGYAPGREPEEGYRGVELDTDEWRMTPMEIDSVRSGFFEDPDRFPRESVAFDCGLLMRDIGHRWKQCESICETQE